MTRIYLRLSLLPFMIFMAVALLIRTQPYDERAPIAVLVPITCRTPCFMGIRPSVTTIDEAITLLRKNEWVSQVIVLPNEIHPNQVGWLWSQKAPDYLQRGGAYVDGQILPNVNRKVSSIWFSTSLKAGDIPIILGDPQEDGLIVAGLYIPQHDPRMKLLVEFWYPAYHLWMSVDQSCPYDADFWQMPVRISITDYDARTAVRTMGVEKVAHPQLVSNLRRLSLQVCGY
ncbi:MAG: hypothetical protein H0X30_07915 [Anaerolineae bacterium]|nr:hypothetical protein [Anaerolineae bacterium]